MGVKIADIGFTPSPSEQLSSAGLGDVGTRLDNSKCPHACVWGHAKCRLMIGVLQNLWQRRSQARITRFRRRFLPFHSIFSFSALVVLDAPRPSRVQPPTKRTPSLPIMDGMSMPMAMPTPTTAGIASASFVAAALETSTARTTMGASSSVVGAMQGMSSFVHFGFGDPFLASLLTPVNMAGYLALLFLLAMLSFLSRVLLIASDKADKKWWVPAHVHTSESGPGSGIWIKDEEKQLETASPNKVTVLSASLLIARSMLKVLNAAVAYLMYVLKTPTIKFPGLTKSIMVVCSEL